MRKYLFVVAPLVALAGVLVSGAPAVAKAPDSWRILRENIKVGDRFGKVDVTFYSNGKYTKLFKIDGWPCHNDPGGSDSCACGMVMRVKGRDGQSITFSGEGKMSGEAHGSWTLNKDGTSQDIANHYAQLTTQDANVTYTCKGVSPSWFSGLLGDLVDAVKVLGPIIASL